VLEQILPNLYRLEIPLPGNPLKAVNSYVVKGKERHLIIDTGLNRQECRDALLGGLRALAVEIDSCDFFMTHMHADHAALIPSLLASEARVYASAVDAKHFNSYNNFSDRFRMMRENAQRNGLNPEDVEQIIKGHPAHKYGPERPLDFMIVQDGTPISIGEYNFICIETPGHTVGHMCLYEPEKKVLFSGDHILGDITPNISHWFGPEDVLGAFLQSLAKIAALPVELVLPGHRRILTDCRQRISELIHHHENRTAELYAALDDGPLTACEVAARMTWGVANKKFSEFPGTLKWFATGETIAHARYLEVRGDIKSEIRGARIVYYQT